MIKLLIVTYSEVWLECIIFLGRFTEDGSFIGQYVPSNMKQIGTTGTPSTNNNAVAAYV